MIFINYIYESEIWYLDKLIRAVKLCVNCCFKSENTKYFIQKAWKYEVVCGG